MMTTMTATMTTTTDGALFEEELPGGAMWSHVVKRHHTLRLTDVEGGVNVGMLLYNADRLSERYNMPDTLKAQHTAFITRGRVLMSDMGCALFSVTEDTCGWHDTICGHLDADATAARYGVARYQQHRNAFHRAARDSFLIELAKWGLGARDVVPNLNFFSRAVADEAGALRFVPGSSPAGSYVDLRAELNVLVVLNTAQHPLDPSTAYAPRRLRLGVRPTPPPGPGDICRLSRPEAARAIENSERFFL
jgi:urea carboxylase-associated protein 2